MEAVARMKTVSSGKFNPVLPGAFGRIYNKNQKEESNQSRENSVSRHVQMITIAELKINGIEWLREIWLAILREEFEMQ